MIPETEIAARVVEWLESQYWDVYQEVAYNGKVADIVATSGYLTWIIECKRSLSLALLEQAMIWKQYGVAHYLSVATPYKFHIVRGGQAAIWFLRQQGIGLIYVRPYEVHQNIPAKLYRRAFTSLRKSLNDRQKTYVKAGNADGRYWTPFQETCRTLRRFVGENPGVCLKDAINGIRHHYSSDSSARACISQYLQSGKNIVKGVECRREGKYLNLYPEGNDNCGNQRAN
jgi:hypothetical protein